MNRYSRAQPQRSALFIDEAIIEWRGVRCHVRQDKCFRNSVGWCRIAIRVEQPSGHPLPIDESGAHAIELEQAKVREAGGVAAYFIAWLDREAESKRYARALFAWNQRDLFGS